MSNFIDPAAHQTKLTILYLTYITEFNIVDISSFFCGFYLSW